MVADITYDKSEGNVVLSMEQHIARRAARLGG